MKKLCSILLVFIMLFGTVSGIEMSVSAANVSGDQIVAEARKHIGKSYVANTAGPDTFDCSGLTMYVFAKFGISLPHSTYDIYNYPTRYGTVIQSDACDKALPGDLICWSGHIGIYTGMYPYYGTERGFLVDAANPSKGVVEQPIWASNGSYKVVRVNGVTNHPVPVGNMTVPKITLNRESYGVANTVGISWEKTDADTDFRYYKIEIKNNTNGITYVSTTNEEDNVDDNTFYLKLTVPGTYTVTVYSVPYNEVSKRQRSASKSFTVGRYINSVDELYKEILVPADPDDPTSVEHYEEIVDLSGWAYDKNGNVYFGINDTLAKGWLRYSYRWYFFDREDRTMCTGWLKDNDTWYYLYDGAMLTGWIKDNNRWYYTNSSGAMLTQWQYIDDYWYYFNPSGAMHTGWKLIGNYWYYFDLSGSMATRWRLYKGDWYFMLSSGRMSTGWVRVNGVWYYFEDSGVMRYDSLEYKGKTYYFDSNGACTNP